jgi:HK97 family phage portal protein
MGVFARALKAGVGYPNPGWAPPYGYSGDSIAAPVNQNTAMGVGAFTAGIRLIAEDIASMPLITYERLAKGKRRAPEHPAYAMLHDSPNPEMTSMVFRETGVAHMYSWGNWYAEKELNGLGVPVRLWPLRPDRMTVEISRETGKREYKYRLPDGSGVIIPADRMFHVPGWGFDGLIGYSRVTLMRRALESSIVATDYGLRTLANNARPGVTIMSKEQLTKTAKTNIVESWDEMHAGLSNSQRTAILDEGMTLDTMGFSPEDAQFLGSKQWSTVEVAQGLRLAPHKLSDFTKATFANIEEANIDHVVGTLGPPVTRIEQQISKDIIADPRYFTEHLMEGLLRGKFKERVEGEVALRLNGLATDDELREIENRNPLTVEERQGLLLPLNSVPASSYDALGMTANQRGLLVAALVRAGYDPKAALLAYGLPDVPHTGFLPATVQTELLLEPDVALANTNGTATGAPR